jgi:homoserine O-acetyltransferase/O-succinyltransferase
MRVLEWLVGYPSRASSALVLAVGATATGDQIGTQSAQLRAITSDPHWNGGDYYAAAAGAGPHEGMGLARRIAHLTYRSADELQTRFGNEPQDGEDPLRDGRFAVQSYLDYQATKLARRFDAGTYVALTDAMNTHDVGRGRGGVAAALGFITAPVIVAGVDSDRLYPLVLQRELAQLIPTTVGGLRIVHSDFGHDGFLIERDAVGALVRETLAVADRVNVPC